MKFSLTRLKKNFSKSVQSDFSMRIYAVILAVIAWFIISVALYPEISVTVKNIPLKIDLGGSVAGENGLSVTSQPTKDVTVRLKGNRTVVGNIKAEDLTATIDIGAIAEAGEHDLGIIVSSVSGKVFEVTSITPETAKVSLDRIITKTFDVVAEVPNVQADTEKGYTRDDPVALPNTVEISGPEVQVNKITKCVVRNETLEVLSESREITSGSELLLYNGTNVLSNADFKITNSSFSVQVPISMRKTLAIKPVFSNFPTNFPIGDMQYTMDVTEIEVAAPNDVLKNIGELTIGTIDLRKVDIGTVISLPVQLPEGYRNLSGIDQVTVTFASEGLSKKKINVKNADMIIINPPPNFDVKSRTTGFTVSFVGPTDVISQLTIQDVVVVIDLASVDIPSTDYYSAPVIITVPNKGCTWALNSYTAVVEATEKQTP